MIVVDVLLAANLILFVVCALRVPRQTRTNVDGLFVVARPQAASQVPPNAPSNVVPFVSRHELILRRARTAHPATAHVPSP